MKKIFIILFCLSLFAFSENKFTVRCIGVHDGDTITILTTENQQLKIRLNGIDAPELHQDFGQRSRQYLAAMVFGKTIEILSINIDIYGRTLAIILFDNENVNYKMVAAGMAWHYTKYSNNANLRKAEDFAKGNKIGLWSMLNPIPPWKFRYSIK